jgi:uracil permease
MVMLPSFWSSCPSIWAHQVVTSKIVARDLLKPGLHRSIFGYNFSTAISGLLGSVPTTTYGETSA